MATNDGGFIGQDGLNAPDSPTGVSATAGDAQATISFTAPSDVGGSAITGYRAQSNDGIGASGSSSPITVTGLTNGTSYTFNVWAINAFGWSGPSDASGSVSPFGARAIFGSYSNMQYVTISTLGNAASFGNFSTSRNGRAACSSSSRAVFGGGELSSTAYNEISFVEFATTGNATDFGDLTVARYQAAGASSSTRGLFATGQTISATIDVIDYITIASAGNATDFGDASDNYGYTNRAGSGGLASSTRAVFGGGVTSGTNDIDRTYYVTIATTGNGTGFGGLTVSRTFLAGASNSTRGLFAGGFDYDTGSLNVIDYITISTTGDATDFGDLTAARHYVGGAASSTRALFASTTGSNTTIDYVTIASTGNAADFGDITNSGNGVGGCSSAHGGLS